MIGLEFIISGVVEWGCVDLRKTQRNPLICLSLSSSPLQKLSVSPTTRITPVSASWFTRCAPATTWICSSPASSASTSSPWPWSTTSSQRYWDSCGGQAGGHAELCWAGLRPGLLSDLHLCQWSAASYNWLPAQSRAFGTWILLHLSLLVKCKLTALKMRLGAGLLALLD